MMGMWMIFMDAPEHTRLRKLMNQGFSPAVVEALRPQIEPRGGWDVGEVRLRKRG